MANGDIQAKLGFVTATGRDYDFKMGMDKAVAFSQHVSGCKAGGSKSWIDVWDYTEAANGQFMINMHSIESLYIEPIKSEVAEQEPAEEVISA